MELNELRRIAEAATPGPWDLYSTQDYEVFCAANFTDSNYDPPAVTYGSDRSEDAEFIAAFDPPTVLALLSLLEQAEQAVERKQSALDTVARIVETQCEAVVLATDSQDLIGEDLDGDWDAVWGRLSELADAKRTAEQAVARVREVCDSEAYEVSNEFGDYDAVAVENIIDALDGDVRE